MSILFQYKESEPLSLSDEPYRFFLCTDMNTGLSVEVSNLWPPTAIVGEAKRKLLELAERTQERE